MAEPKELWEQVQELAVSKEFHWNLHAVGPDRIVTGLCGVTVVRRRGDWNKPDCPRCWDAWAKAGRSI